MHKISIDKATDPELEESFELYLQRVDNTWGEPEYGHIVPGIPINDKHNQVCLVLQHYHDGCSLWKSIEEYEEYMRYNCDLEPNFEAVVAEMKQARADYFKR